uniref:Uncharacterized protein n=1 Tax=Micromonospora echinospora TaxID=1877 RepID=Q2MG34_MICEC|nr:hypothetical protein [Micromonospora echinospora]
MPGARGHVVLSFGPDDAGEQALAIWKLGPTGQANGAWILSLNDLPESRDHLLRVFRLVQGWCLVDWRVETAVSHLDQLRPWVPTGLVEGLRGHVVGIPALIDEIREQRQRYAEAVEEYRSGTRSKILPLEWNVTVPEDEDAERLLTPAVPDGAAPVAAQALKVAGAVRRTAALWQDTEQVRYRRSFLRTFGEPQLLPPQWLASLRTAAASMSEAGTK